MFLDSYISMSCPLPLLNSTNTSVCPYLCRILDIQVISLMAVEWYKYKGLPVCLYNRTYPSVRPSFCRLIQLQVLDLMSVEYNI